MRHRGRASWGEPCSTLLIWLLTLFLWCGCETPRGSSAIPVQTTHLKLGLCEDYPKESRTIDEARRDLLLLKTNGIHYLRIAFAWEAMEPQRGKFDWNFWDDYVRIASELDIQLIPYVCYTPEWAASKPGNDFWRSPPLEAAAFGEFMYALASHYRGRVFTWELWNEPDNPEYWTGSVEQFAELIRAGSSAVRRADPNVKVVLGGLAWNLKFLENLLQEPGMATNFDIVNLHSYLETWSPNPAEATQNQVAAADRLLRDFRAQKPLWLAEVGYSNYRSNSYVSPSYHSRFDYEHRPEFQAVTVFRMLIPVLADGQVELAAWYRIHDLPEKQNVIGDVNNRRLGVLDLHDRPKPVLSALRFFHDLFGEGVTPADERVRVESTIASDAELHAFYRKDKTLVVVAWLKVITPHTDPAEGSDRRLEKLRLRLPDRYRRGEVYDELGRHVSSTHVGHAETTTLELTGGNVRVLVFR